MNIQNRLRSVPQFFKIRGNIVSFTMSKEQQDKILSSTLEIPDYTIKCMNHPAIYKHTYTTNVFLHGTLSIMNGYPVTVSNIGYYESEELWIITDNSSSTDWQVIYNTNVVLRKLLNQKEQIDGKE